MEQAGYGLTEAAFGGIDARTKGDAALLVRFYNNPIEDPVGTLEAGRPIFKEVTFIEIRTPGSTTSVVARKVRQQDKDRFPEHWRRYQARSEGEEILVGTPLEEWPMITRSTVEELKYFNIRTVEQLAELSDVACQNMMGIQPLREKANEFLAAASSNESLLARIEALEAEKKELAQKAEKKPRGRPKKVEETTVEA